MPVISRSLLAIPVVGAFVVWWAVSDPTPARAQQPVDPGAEVVEVKLQHLDPTASIGGTIVPARQITFTAQIPGRVEFLAGAEGAAFRTGEILVGIDEAELLAQREAAVAQITNAQAAVRNAGVQYDRELRSPRSSSMFSQMMPIPMFGTGKRGIERTADLYSAGTHINDARTALSQARARLREIDAKFRDTKSVAPFDGVIVKKLVEVGDPVQPGQPLIEYADMGVLQVQADVPARLAAGLREGMTLPVRLDDVDRSQVPARVAQVFPMADPTHHTRRIKLDLPPDAPATAGMYTKVIIPEPRAAAGGSDVPVIPLTAVFQRSGLPMVAVVNPKGYSELRLVRLGEMVGNDNIAVLTGLYPGEKVLLEPPKR
jgi:multidrug efflux pump subunit AcrA (membrane-fusion protein)